MTTQPTVVWAEIPVTDLDAAARFYDEVFGYSSTVDRSGPQHIAVLGGMMDGVGAHLFEGEPNPGVVLHLAVRGRLEDAAERLTRAGGSLIGAPAEIPVGRFHYATDPDGNKLGLFEPKGM